MVEAYANHPIIREAKGILIGRRIVNVRQLTKEEAEKEGMDRTTTALILDDGTILYPASDDEGNDVGALFGIYDGVSGRFGFQGGR